LACGSDRDSTANDAKPIKFFYTIRWWYITFQEIARFSIGVLVVEVSTETVVVVVFCYAIRQWRLTNTRF